MNRTYSQILSMLLIVVFIVSIGIVFINAGIAKKTSPEQDFELSMLAKTGEVSTTSSRTLNTTLHYLAPADFSENITVDVTQNVLVNYWLSASINTTVFIENNQKRFNTFNIFVPRYEYKEIQYINFAGEAIKHDIVDDGISAYITIKVQTPDIYPSPTASNYTFSYLFGVGNLVKILPDRSLTEWPYKVNCTFLPLFSIPITNYHFAFYLNAKSQYAIYGINSAVVTPTTAEIGATHNATDFSVTYANVTSLPSIELSSLATVYNFSRWDLPIDDIQFIPGFNTTYAANMTYFFNVEFQINTPCFKYDSSKTVIEVTQWGDIKFTESISLHLASPVGNCVGGTAWSDPTAAVYGKFTYADMLRVYGPKDIIVDQVKDSYGNVSSLISQMDYEEESGRFDVSKVDIFPRYSLRPGDIYEFTIKYHFQAKDYMNALGGDKYEMWSTLGLFTEWTVEEKTVEYIFPLGADITVPAKFSTDTFRWQAFQLEKTSAPGILGINKPTLKLTFTNLSQYQNIKYTVTYSLPFYWMLLEPAVYMLLIFLIGLILVAIKQLDYLFMTSTTMSPEEIPYDLIEQFVTTYQEKTALRDRILQLDEEKERKGVQKTQQQLLILQQKLKDTDRQLVNIVGEFAKQGKTYKDAIQTIEISEAERTDILRSIADLEKNKKERRIGEATYNKLFHDFQKRLKKTNSTIDKTLIELRSFLTEKTHQ